jgi:peptide/nickel transport system permease protein
MTDDLSTADADRQLGDTLRDQLGDSGSTASLALGQAVRTKHPLLVFVVRRIAVGVILLFVVSILIFVFTEILPGNAAYAILGRNADPKALAAVSAQLGLNKPATVRYFSWLTGFLHGNLGQSLTAHEAVTTLIGGRILNTVILAGLALAVLTPLALALGILAGTRAGRLVDHVISTVSLAGIALPDFIVATILIFAFAITLKAFPPVSLVPTGVTPLSQPLILALPVATLVIVGLAYMSRMVRAGIIDVMGSEYIQMARLNGLSERRVIFHHALRNALAPTVQVTALTLQWLVGGIFIVESIFAYPGIGQGMVQAVIARDVPTVQSVGMLIATFYVTVNILADVTVVLLIPKLRTA